MKKLLAGVSMLFFLTLTPIATAQTQNSFSKDEYYKARVLEITPTQTVGLSHAIVKLENGQTQEIDFGSQLQEIGVKPNANIVVVKNEVANEVNWYIADIYRASQLTIWMLLFATIALFLGRAKGAGALVGLGLSIGLVTMVLLPLITKGYNPVATTIIVGGIFSIISLYLAHGISRRTTAAAISTILCIALAGLLSVSAVYATRLTGEGSESSFFIAQLGLTSSIDLRGLLLAGIILGVLGILDDVTTAQSATVDELIKANPTAHQKTIYTQALSVGREHISSLVNTLFLAYAGASLPLFLLFSAYARPPLWVILNNQYVAEEIIRTVTGSIVLMCAVPLSTLIAIKLLYKK